MSEMVSVVVLSLPFLRDTLVRLQYLPGVTQDMRDELAQAIKVITDVTNSTRPAVELFDRLRRAM